MKRWIALLLGLLLLTACGKEEERPLAIPAEESAAAEETKAEENAPEVPEPVETEPENTESENEEPEDTEPSDAELIPDGGPEEAFCEYGYGSIRLQIPGGWEWEESPYDEETGLFGIRFWPAGQEGKAALYCWTQPFGVCGTGLTEEEVTFAGGLRAMMGTYDTEECWNFISFREVPGDYVVINEGCESWWPDFQEEFLLILDTAEFGERAMSYAEMAEIAGGLDTPDAAGFWADYDVLRGVWTIRYYDTAESAETVMTVCIDNEGHLIRNAE